MGNHIVYVLPSTEYFPPPASSSARKAPAYMKGSSPLPGPVKRAPWAVKKAVIMVIRQASAAKRVAKPITSRNEQNTSANVASARLAGEPMPKGSAKRDMR